METRLMANAWGKSWASAWGKSFGFDAQDETAPLVSPAGVSRRAKRRLNRQAQIEVADRRRRENEFFLVALA